MWCLSAFPLQSIGIGDKHQVEYLSVSLGYQISKVTCCNMSQSPLQLSVILPRFHPASLVPPPRSLMSEINGDIETTTRYIFMGRQRYKNQGRFNGSVIETHI